MSAVAHAPHPEGFRHEALVYNELDEFLAGALSFIRGGARAGEPVLVAVEAGKIELLRAELNGDGERVRYLDMTEVGRNPARLIPLWRRFADDAEAAGVAARGIGEPAWPARSSAELTEFQRHEALLNVAFDGGHPFSLLCPYDAGRLPDDVLAEARRSHPVLRSARREQPSRDFEPGVDVLAGELPAPAGPVRELRYGVAEIPDARAFARAFASQVGLPEERAQSLVMAVNELATNSVRHATGSGTVRVWAEEDTLLCEVEDHGEIEDPLAGRVAPAPDARGGRGLWIVNQLCDLVQVRSSRAGTVVRLHLARH